MSVGILLITHPGIGSSILHSANRILGSCALNTKCLEVPSDVSVTRIQSSAETMIGNLNQGQGVLLLTDLYGATPNNLARDYIQKDQVAVLAGLNLSMLLRVFNYPDLPLDELCSKAVEGGIKGIHKCNPDA